jgi:RNA polymerase sigma-70 factor (ECF subfamily)
MELENTALALPPFADDIQLATDVLNKDRKATAEFVKRYSGPVYGFVRRRLAYRPEVVDDLVQDVFLAAWRGLERYRGESTLQTWLLAIARHKVDDLHRRRIQETPWPEEGQLADEAGRSFQTDQEQSAEHDRMYAVLRVLPEAYSLALTLRYLEELTVRQMAELMGKTEKAVERTLARAREQFKKRWSDDAAR